MQKKSEGKQGEDENDEVNELNYREFQSRGGFRDPQNRPDYPGVKRAPLAIESDRPVVPKERVAHIQVRHSVWIHCVPAHPEVH